MTYLFQPLFAQRKAVRLTRALALVFVPLLFALPALAQTTSTPKVITPHPLSEGTWGKLLRASLSKQFDVQPPVTPPATRMRDTSGETQEQTPAKPDAAQSPQDKENLRVNPITGTAASAGDSYKPLTREQRWKLFLDQNFTSPGAYIGVLAGALIDQGNRQPPEWGQGVKGYGIRFASRFGTNLVQGTIQSSLAAAMHLEVRYVRSTSTNHLHRIGHALALGVMNYNEEGKLRLNFPLLAGNYGSGMITTYWMPSRYTPLGDGVRDGNRQMILGGLFNIVQEYWPEIKRVTHLKGL